MEPQSPPPHAAPTARIFLFTGPGTGGPGIGRLTAIARAHGATVVAAHALPAPLDRDHFDLVILPGGSAGRQLRALGAQGKAAIRSFVAAGGGYLGVCAGAFAGSGCTQTEDFGLRLLPALYLRHKQNSGDVKGTVTLALQGDAREWAGGAAEVPCHYHNGPLFPAYQLPRGVEALAVVREGVRGVPRMRHRAVLVAGWCGRGRVVLCGPHPEQTEGLEEFTWRMMRAALPAP